ncbi:MAG: hypothetical protein ICV83_29175 [Cytophagales bacterium]|nr:hypothetical protein [Cytophagales bacterium]
MLQNAPSRAGRTGYALLFVLALLSSCNDRENPGPGPAASPKLKKLAYTQNDFQEFTYSTDGLLSRYRSQWNFVEGEDGQLKNFFVDFHYDNGKKLKELTFANGGGPVKYVYEGNVLKKTEEYDHKGRLVITHYYTFGGNRLTEVRDVINDLDDQSQRQLKRTYEYDAKGNLTAQREYYLNVGTEAFVQTEVTTFEGYDDKKNPEGQLDVYPYLPHVRLRVNNPARKTRTATTNGSRVTWIEEYTYEYNAEGYPLKKVTKITVPGADPVPLRTGTYEYQQ